jgi:hypothetical protein
MGQKAFGNRHLSERQIVKLCEAFGQVMLCRGAVRDDLGWDAKDESARESGFGVVDSRRCR